MAKMLYKIAYLEISSYKENPFNSTHSKHNFNKRDLG